MKLQEEEEEANKMKENFVSLQEELDFLLALPGHFKAYQLVWDSPQSPQEEEDSWQVSLPAQPLPQLWLI